MSPEEEAWKRMLRRVDEFYRVGYSGAVVHHKTEFERLLEKERLSEAEAIHSPVVREWVGRCREGRYVPEWILAKMEGER